jgi:hypothetical protein
MFHLKQTAGIFIFFGVASYQCTWDPAGGGHLLAGFYKGSLQVLWPKINYFF